MLAVIKVGGSIVTDKNNEATFAETAAVAVGRACAMSSVPMVLVHGTGSYGKPPAVRHGYLDGFLASPEVVSEVGGLLDELRFRMLRALREAGMNAVGISTASVVTTRNGAIERFACEAIRDFLGRGLTPVLSGDLVCDAARGFAVCSSDDIAIDLAITLRADRLVLATDVPGIIAQRDGFPVVVPEVNDWASASRELEHDGKDVSGGMRGKLAAAFRAAQAGIPVTIVDGRDPERVRAALAGEAVEGTRLTSCAR